MKEPLSKTALLFFYSRLFCERVPPNPLQISNKSVLDSGSFIYIVETHNKNGAYCPLSTLCQLLIGILWHLRMEIQVSLTCWIREIQLSNIFMEPSTLIFKRCINLVLAEKFNTLSWSLGKTKTNYGHLVRREETHQEHYIMWYSFAAIVKISFFEMVKNIETLSFLSVSI